MKIRLSFLLLFLTAFSAAAQAPVKTVSHYPSVKPAAEIHFVDGNVGHYPVMRIGKDLMRVDIGDSQSQRMPLTYVESIKFNDGCTLFFDKGAFQFDKLVMPALLKNEGGDALLEGVLALNKSQTEALMGAEAFRTFQKNSRLVKIGMGTIATGTMLTIPYVSSFVLNAFKTEKIIEVGRPLAIAGGTLVVSGLVMYILGNNKCNRVVATYNDGLGVAYTF
jgi:hypothetical protein